MKLAELERDGWELEDGAARHAEYPKSFWIPSAWRRYPSRRFTPIKVNVFLEFLLDVFGQLERGATPR